MANVNYAENMAQRTPCILILDASASMGQTTKNGKQKIDLLNEGIGSFHSALNADEMALSRVQIAAINVGGVMNDPMIMMDWTDANQFQPFKLTAAGMTPLGTGVRLALESIEEHKAGLKAIGISYTRPWMFLITDGEPTDNVVWEAACQEANEAETESKVEIFPIGVDEANIHALSQLGTIHPPRMMDETKFNECFLWLSASLGQMARSVAGSEVELPDTDPWASVKL